MWQKWLICTSHMYHCPSHARSGQGMEFSGSIALLPIFKPIANICIFFLFRKGGSDVCVPFLNFCHTSQSLDSVSRDDLDAP